MFMGRVAASPESDVVRELQGARILLTGLTAGSGVDVARAFADIKARLVVHTCDLSPEMTALIALLSQSASEIKLYTGPIESADASVRFAQNAAQAFGGLDAVINIASITNSEMNAVNSDRSLEQLAANKLTPLAHLTAVTANRMRVVLSEGLILNVLNMPHPATKRDMAIATFARAALTSMTKTEAAAWANQGIRVNAIGPRAMLAGASPSGSCLTNEPDIAALAIYLASRRGKTLSGYVFDSDGISAEGG